MIQALELKNVNEKEVIVERKKLIYIKEKIMMLIEASLSTESILNIGIAASYYKNSVRKETEIDNSDWSNFFEMLKEHNRSSLAKLNEIEMAFPACLEKATT